MKKVIVVGMGFMGVTHAKNILANLQLDLCGIVDNRGSEVFRGMDNLGNAGKLDVPTAKLKQVPVFTSLMDSIDTIKPDAAIICTPLFLHYEMAKQCLETGLDVLLEKPFCTEAAKCIELIELAKLKQQILMVAHCIRFAPQYEFLAQCIRDERYGRLRWLSTSRVTGEPTWGVWQNSEIKKTCGGSLLDLVIHDLDFANYCFGVPADVMVNAHCGEYWEVALQYNHEATISIKGGFMHRNTPFAAEYAATFEHASLHFCSLQPDVVHVGTDDGAQDIAAGGDSYCEELKYFTECIYKRADPQRCLPESSLHTIKLCHVIETKVHKNI